MRVVGAIIKNGQNEYLLQLRDDKAPNFKNKWTLFGGHVEDSESPQAALMRELHEELKLDPYSVQSIQHIQTNEENGGTEQYIFEVLTDASLDQLFLGEGAAMGYIPGESLFDREFAFNIEAVLRQYINAP